MSEPVVSVEVTGRIPKRVQSLGDGVFMDAALFFTGMVFKGCKVKGVCTVDIEFVKPEGDFLGQALYLGDGDVEIQLNPMQSQRSTLLTLAHELVHAKQYITGEMKDSRKSIDYTIWRNKQIKINDHSYYDLPWEVEAMGREYGLYRRWVESRNYSGKYAWANTSF